MYRKTSDMRKEVQKREKQIKENDKEFQHRQVKENQQIDEGKSLIQYMKTIRQNILDTRHQIAQIQKKKKVNNENQMFLKHQNITLN